MTRHLLKLVWNRKRTNALLTLEIFCSFLVLFGVATFVTSMILRYRRPLGFDDRNVWVAAVPFQGPPRAEDDPEHRQMIDLMLRELRSMPQIEAASASGTPPCSPATWDSSGDYNGRHYEVTHDVVTDDFEKTMNVRLLQGRWFGPQDDAAAQPPAVIDTDAAKQIAPDGKALGMEFDFGSKRPARIVGIIAPFRKDGEFSKDRVSMVFERLSLTKSQGAVPHYLLARVRPGTRADFELEVVKRLRAVAPDHPVRIIHMEAMHQSRNRAFLAPAILAGIVALFLIVMVFLGLSGVLWQNVTRRTREIGLRRALGATAPVVHRTILIEVAILTTLAVIVGVIIVAQLPIVGIFRFVTPTAYAIGLAASLATLYALTLLCGLYPSWLAGRVQPAQALHYE